MGDFPKSSHIFESFVYDLDVQANAFIQNSQLQLITITIEIESMTQRTDIHRNLKRHVNLQLW